MTFSGACSPRTCLVVSGNLACHPERLASESSRRAPIPTPRDGGVLVIFTTVPRDSAIQYATRRSARSGTSPCTPRASTLCEFPSGLIDSQFSITRAGSSVAVRPCRCPRRLPIQPLYLLAHRVRPLDQYASLRRTTRRPAMRPCSVEVRIQPATPTPRQTSKNKRKSHFGHVVDRIPSLARKQTSAASIIEAHGFLVAVPARHPVVALVGFRPAAPSGRSEHSWHRRHFCGSVHTQQTNGPAVHRHGQRNGTAVTHQPSFSPLVPSPHAGAGPPRRPFRSIFDH